MRLPKVWEGCLVVIGVAALLWGLIIGIGYAILHVVSSIMSVVEE